MLTELEMKVLNRILGSCTKSVTIPFSWESQRMTMKTSPSRIYNFLSWLLLLSSLSFKFSQVPLLLDNRDINGLILHGLFVVAFAASTIFKLNIWLHKTELVSLLNQIMEINHSWG